jgi:hypothetical protein
LCCVVLLYCVVFCVILLYCCPETSAHKIQTLVNHTKD